jgi:hypothetical protein
VLREERLPNLRRLQRRYKRLGNRRSMLRLALHNTARSSALLHNVRQLMGEKLFAALAFRRVLARAEYDVLPWS